MASATLLQIVNVIKLFGIKNSYEFIITSWPRFESGRSYTPTIKPAFHEH